MEIVDYPLMPTEYEAAADGFHCILEEDKDEPGLLQRAVHRRLVNAARGGPAMTPEDAEECVGFLCLPREFITSVGFPISDEFAALCVEALKDTASCEPDERRAAAAYALARSIHHELQV